MDNNTSDMQNGAPGEQRTHRRRQPAAESRGGGHGARNFLLGTAAVVAVAGVILSVVDVGGGVILKVAQNVLREQLGMELRAEGIGGNPIRGWTLHDFSVSPQDAPDREIISAKSLSAGINFMSLLRGAPRLSHLGIGGVEMDLDEFMARLSSIKLPESDGSGEFDVPIDRITLDDSRFTSKWGSVEVAEIGAGIDGRSVEISVDGSVNGVPVKGSAAMDVAGGTTIAINKSDVSFGSGKASVVGEIRPLSATDTRSFIGLHGSARDISLKDLAALWRSTLSPDDYEGRVSVNVETSGTAETIKIFGSADYKGTSLAGYPVERVSANVSYGGGRVSVTNIQASALNIPISGEAAIDTASGQTPSVILKLDGGEANLDGLESVFPALKGLSGRVTSFGADINGKLDALSGIASIAAPKVSYSGTTVSNIAAQLKFSGGNSASVNGKFVFEGAQGYVQGTADSIFSGPKFNMTANLVDLDLRSIVRFAPQLSQHKPSGKVTAKLAIKGSTSSPSVSGTLSSSGVSAAGYSLANPSVSFAFAKDTLTIDKSSGSFNNMPFHLSGTVSRITSKAPALNVTAGLTLTPASLKAFVPDIGSYALKGEVLAGVKVTGTTASPSISLTASSKSLGAMNMLSARDLEVTAALGGAASIPDNLAADIKAGSFTASGVTFTNITARAEMSGSTVKLANFSARSGSGTISGGGTAGTSQSSKIDMNFSLNALDLAPLASASGVSMKGVLTGKIGLGGTVSAPSFSFTGSAPSVTAQGFTLSGVEADVSGGKTSMNINKFRASVGGAPLTAGGNVKFSPLAANVTINGSDLDLAALTKEYKEIAGQLAGKASLTFTAATDASGNVSGKGSISSSGVRAFGLKLTGVKLPIAFAGSKLTSQGGAAQVCGGTLSNNLTFDIDKMTFSDKLSAANVDINQLIQDLSGGIGGTISGRGKLDMNISGSAGSAVKYSGSGTFSMGQGAISGFSALDIVARLHGVSGLRYSSVKAPFTIQTGKLILKAGAVANAEKNDPLWRYLKMSRDGGITFEGALNLPIEASANYQLINALLGGGSGALQGLGAIVKSGGSITDALKDVVTSGIQGAKAGGAEADFRTVTLRVTGKAASPSVADVKIGESTLKKNTAPSAAPADTKPAAQPKPTAQPQKKPAEQIKEQVKDKLKDKLGIPSPTAQPSDQPQKSREDQIVDTLLDKVLPGSKPSGGSQNAAPSEQQKSRTDEVKDKVREELGKGLKKGLGELLKRK